MQQLTLSEHARRVRAYLMVFAKWTACALVIGLTCGALGAAFHHGVELAAALFGRFAWMLYLLPLLGLVIVWMYRAAGVTKDRGTNLVLSSMRAGEPASFRAAPLIFAATCLTHLGGGSSGREGAALQIGAGVASVVSRVLRFRGQDARTATRCGMAGLFSAVFGTPVTAAVFCVEVCSVGRLNHAALYPCLLSSLAAWEISSLLGGHAVRFTLTGMPEVSGVSVAQVLLLTILCALCSILFLRVLHGAEHLLQRIRNPYLRVAAGGAAIVLLTLLVGRDYNGAGMGIVERAVAGSAVPWAFLLKILFTALTIGSGFKGGEIVPTFFIGATFGCAVGPLLGLEPGFAAAVGLVALFCCVVNCPLASIFLAAELFGGEGLTFFALACALGYIMSGYASLYGEQRILHSKLLEDEEL